MSKLPKNKKSRLRCEQILDVAFELFLQHGYENVSLSDIIAKSGGSLSSIYKYFGNKDDLFLRVVDFHTERLDKKLGEDALKIDISLKTEEYLSKFGKIYLDFLYDNETKNFFKNILLSSSQSFGMLSGVSKVFLDSSVLSFPNPLKEYFSAHQNDFKTNQSPEDLALHFCFLLREPWFYRLIFFGEEPDQNNDRENFIKNRIEIFLNGVKK